MCREVSNAYFFQEEDVIRAPCVTGVQPCALPISTDYPLDRVEVLVADGRSDEHFDAVQRVIGRKDRVQAGEIGRASCRERVEISVVAVSLKKKKFRSRFRMNLTPERSDSNIHPAV